jgi:hypothetical protein
MRCKFRTQPSTATQGKPSSLSYAPTKSEQWVAKKTPMATLVVLLGLGGGYWVTSEVLAPQIVQADTARVDLSLDRKPNETYDELVRRAEVTATAATQARFEQNTQVTNVALMIVAQNQGAIAPLLSLQVSRTQWQSRPDAQRWATYFTSAKALLRFDGVATKTGAQTETANPGSTSGGTTSSYPSQSGIATPSSSRGRYPNRYPGQQGNGTRFSPPFAPRVPSNVYPGGQAGTASPYTSPYTSGQPANIYPGQAGTNTPSTLGQPANSYPGQAGTTNPNTFIQTPAPGSGISPQAPTAAPVLTPGSTQNSTIPNSSTRGIPSTSTPANGLQTPVAPSSTGGTTINYPGTTSLPNSSGNTR